MTSCYLIVNMKIYDMPHVFHTPNNNFCNINYIAIYMYIYI